MNARVSEELVVVVVDLTQVGLDAGALDLVEFVGFVARKVVQTHRLDIIGAIRQVVILLKVSHRCEIRLFLL